MIDFLFRINLYSRGWHYSQLDLFIIRKLNLLLRFFLSTLFLFNCICYDCCLRRNINSADIVRRKTLSKYKLHIKNIQFYSKLKKIKKSEKNKKYILFSSIWLNPKGFFFHKYFLKDKITFLLCFKNTKCIS
jgi:hypothetical protein